MVPMATSKPGERRVEAWIYAVINPLEEALEREALHGESRVPSYRWRTDDLERLRPLRYYLSRSAALILDDLATYYPAIRDLERRHDALLSELKQRAKQLFAALIENESFREFADQHFQKVSASESRVTEVAESLVNDDPEFVDASEGYPEAWNRALPELKRLREEAGYEPLRAALIELETQSDGMRAELIKLRAKLVEEFQVPPAPLHA